MRQFIIWFCLRTGRLVPIMRLARPDHYQWAQFMRKHGVKIGEGTTVNPGAMFMDCHRITIGRDCSISLATFVTHSGGDRVVNKRHGYPINSDGHIRIGDGVTIGANVTILYGVTIGDDAIIGAGCTIRRNVPAGRVMVPADAVDWDSTDRYVHRAFGRMLQREAQ